MANKAWYCLVKQASVPVRICLKSSTDKLSNSTRIGKRPCNSGIKSDGLLKWNAPEATNKMWSVLIMPYLVCTVVPSTKGNKSRCTPWRDTSAPARSLPAILSISSKNTMPWFSTADTAFSRMSSSLMSLAASSSSNNFIAASTRNFCFLVLPWPILANMPCNCWVKSSIPGGPMMDMADAPCAISISISLSFKLPSRNILRNFWRVLLSGCASWASPSKPTWRGGGNKASNTRFSAASWARSRFFLISVSRTFLMAFSIKSRMMESTSRPT